MVSTTVEGLRIFSGNSFGFRMLIGAFIQVAISFIIYSQVLFRMIFVTKQIGLFKPTEIEKALLAFFVSFAVL